MTVEADEPRALAVITARGGSKRIPRKNIRAFLGRPVLEYPLEAAGQSHCFTKILVSTEDLEIASVAREAGAEVPFLRSAATADDFAGTADVLLEVLKEVEALGWSFQFLCAIYPTAALLTVTRLQEAYRLLLESGADAVLPVLPYPGRIQRALQIEDRCLRYAFPKYARVRSQDLTSSYYDAGQFYWLRVDRFREERCILMPHTLPLKLSEWEAQDIDEEADWQLAEQKYRFRQFLQAK